MLDRPWLETAKKSLEGDSQNSWWRRPGWFRRWASRRKLSPHHPCHPPGGDTRPGRSGPQRRAHEKPV